MIGSWISTTFDFGIHVKRAKSLLYLSERKAWLNQSRRIPVLVSEINPKQYSIRIENHSQRSARDLAVPTFPQMLILNGSVLIFHDRQAPLIGYLPRSSAIQVKVHNAAAWASASELLTLPALSRVSWSWYLLIFRNISVATSAARLFPS